MLPGWFVRRLSRVPMSQPSPQPNIQAPARLPMRFWLLLVATGVGAGLGGGLIMKLLHGVQHLAWSYENGTFLEAVERNSAIRHVSILFGAGILAGVGRWVFRVATGGHGGELAEKIWFQSGNLPLVRTLGRAVLSIVLVGLGESLGREGALKQTGATVASALTKWINLTPPQQRLLVACGAGAGIAVAYNVPFGGALFALEVLLGDLAAAGRPRSGRFLPRYGRILVDASRSTHLLHSDV
jgi:chloride channel protein, CIC family